MKRKTVRKSKATGGGRGVVLGVSPEESARLRDGDHYEPHRILGAHPVAGGGGGVVVRAYHPEADSAECVLAEGRTCPMTRVEAGGLFAVHLADRDRPLDYRLRFHFADGSTWERGDPYRFLPTWGELDGHLFNEGNHLKLWTCMGSHVRVVDGVAGVSFAVWAPNARRVSVVGEFCQWDGRLLPMRAMGNSGVFELFVPGLCVGQLYKYEIKAKDGALRLKTDPFAQAMEGPPGNASRVTETEFTWGDGDWLVERAERDHTRSPVSIYEVHLGSWARVPDENNRPMNYREIAPKLVAHVKRFGYTHVELLPVMEHPFEDSWGYQVTGYFAPTHRWGSPDDFRFFVDYCHRQGIGVILDWVPAHFPKDDFALRRFDGTALYEHEDPRMGEHPDWGTLIFNFGRKEVRNFLVANALYWLQEFHVDGLRVDAVASMLYLDYSRKEGEWLPNEHGGNENLDAKDFLCSVNHCIGRECPGAMTIAEESTSWGGVTKPVDEGGLGFTFKWNMGWMHDTLEYFSREPVHRRFHQNALTFSMLYEHTERFVNALSHDEVVHGKRSMLGKMPGDGWQKFANLRLLYTYQYTRPGKQLSFMGAELAPYAEWSNHASLDWHLADDPLRQGLALYLEDLGRIYLENAPLWRGDPDMQGFAWIECSDSENSVLAYRRDADGRTIVVVLNMTPVPRAGYRIGVPCGGAYRYLLSGDHPAYGGSGHPLPETLRAEAKPWHGFGQSLVLTLPPLAALVLEPVE